MRRIFLNVSPSRRLPEQLDCRSIHRDFLKSPEKLWNCSGRHHGEENLASHYKISNCSLSELLVLMSWVRASFSSLMSVQRRLSLARIHWKPNNHFRFLRLFPSCDHPSRNRRKTWSFLRTVFSFGNFSTACCSVWNAEHSSLAKRTSVIFQNPWSKRFVVCQAPLDQVETYVDPPCPVLLEGIGRDCHEHLEIFYWKSLLILLCRGKNWLFRVLGPVTISQKNQFLFLLRQKRKTLVW